jgi:hypothetical protein
MPLTWIVLTLTLDVVEDIDLHPPVASSLARKIDPVPPTSYGQRIIGYRPCSSHGDVVTARTSPTGVVGNDTDI